MVRDKIDKRTNKIVEKKIPDINKRLFSSIKIFTLKNDYIFLY